MSKSYQGLTATEDLAVLMSKTYYKGEKGDEVADYSYNYKVDAARADELTNVKSTSYFYYGGLEVRAASALRDDAMVMSKSYQGLTATEDLAVLMSKTYYKGEKGDEVADYSYNYKIDAGRADELTNVKSTSYFYYGGLEVRATSALRDDAMVMSKSYQGLTATEDLAVLMSKTYYKGEKGDEVADYSYNYKIDAGRADELTNVKSTSFFYYGGIWK